MGDFGPGLPRRGYTDGTLGFSSCTSSLEKLTIDSPLQQNFDRPGIIFSFAVLPHQQCPSRPSRGDLNITPRSPSQIGRGRQGPAALYWLHLAKRASMRGLETCATTVILLVGPFGVPTADGDGMWEAWDPGTARNFITTWPLTTSLLTTALT
jgi:hypothetical protein